MLKMFPERVQWEAGNLRQMRSVMLDKVREEQAQRREERRRQRETTSPPEQDGQPETVEGPEMESDLDREMEDAFAEAEHLPGWKAKARKIKETCRILVAKLHQEIILVKGNSDQKIAVLTAENDQLRERLKDQDKQLRRLEKLLRKQMQPA